MMKKWYEEKPFTFGIVFLISFIFLDVTDAKWFIPKMRPVCNGEITDQQARACSGWIKKINKKEQNDVRTTERRPRGMHRDTPSNVYMREQERAIDAFGGRENR